MNVYLILLSLYHRPLSVTFSHFNLLLWYRMPKINRNLIENIHGRPPINLIH